MKSDEFLFVDENLTGKMLISIFSDDIYSCIDVNASFVVIFSLLLCFRLSIYRSNTRMHELFLNCIE